MDWIATLLALTYLWSVVLFFVAVFVRERSQARGFGYSLLGAWFFVGAFGDRLPTGSWNARYLIDWLPWTNEPDFSSPWAPLLALVVVYAIRSVVFMKVFGRMSDLEDYVVETPVFLTALIPIVVAIDGLYDLPLWLSGSAFLLACLAYFVGAFDEVARLLNIAGLGVNLVSRKVGRALLGIPTRVLQAVGKVELLRRTFGGRLTDVSERLDDAVAQEKGKQRTRRDHEDEKLRALEDKLRRARAQRKA